MNINAFQMVQFTYKYPSFSDLKLLLEWLKFKNGKLTKE